MIPFDLTTKAGIEAAFNKYPELNRALGVATISSSNGVLPFGYSIVEKVVDWIKNTTDIASPLREQSATAEAVIKAGREYGADEIEMELDQKVGLNLDAMLTGEQVEAQIGKSGKMRLKVKYK